jgi:cytosine/adenosine deaminase-related metal-dependent hydrolase
VRIDPSRRRPTLWRAAWVLPVASPPIRDGAVLVGANGRIAAVALRAALPAPEDAEVVELGEAALLPGMVNVHAHPELAMFRGALEGLPFQDWILRLVSAKRDVLTEEDYTHAARWTVIEALRAGITTVAATEASSAALEALREGGMRGVVYQEVFGPDPRQAGPAIEELRSTVRRLREREDERVRVGISPHAPYTVSDKLFAATAAYAREEALPMAVHIAESAAERRLVVQGEGEFAPGLRARGIETPRRGRSPIEMLDRLGVLAARPLLIHCVDVDTDDIRRIADAGCAVAHCPIANAKLGHGIAPLPELQDAGVRVGMGTDSVGSNNRLDLLEEARFAALVHRFAHRRPDLLPAETLLRLCTLEGARALGWEDRIGTLEPGKEADLCAVSLAAPHVRPVHDPVTALFHAARASDVVLTMVSGRVLYRNGEVLTLDTEKIGAAVDETAERLHAALGAG